MTIVIEDGAPEGVVFHHTEKLPPLVVCEDDATTIACCDAFTAHKNSNMDMLLTGFSENDCDRGSFHCPGCPLTTLERKE